MENRIPEVVPGIGYFGSSPCDSLWINLEKSICAVRLSLKCDAPEILNLTGLQFHDGARVIDWTAGKLQFVQSSSHMDDERYANISLLQQRGIHTKRELHPYWEMHADELIAATSLRVFNRTDEWAQRSRSLTVQVKYSPDGTWQTVYDGLSAVAVLNAFNALSKACGKTVNINDNSERLDAIELVRQRLLEGQIAFEDINWRQILQFVDMWGQAALTSTEAELVAAKIYYEKIKFNKWVVSDTAYMFRTRKAVIDLQRSIGLLAQNFGDKAEWTLTRHGLEPSQLRSRAEDFLRHMEQVCMHLSKLSRNPILAYGTLLGAVRDKDFIAHDDDVDLLYRLNAKSQDEADLEINTIVEYFRHHGFAPIRFTGTLNVQIIAPHTGIAVDIFPYWVNDDIAFLHMEKMLLRGVPLRLLEPSSIIQFYEKEFGAPADPEGFLLARYGSGWNVSDQFFEWPWRLIDN